MKYTTGYKFIVSSHDKLITDGWHQGMQGSSYSHAGFPKCVMLTKMITKHHGETLTVRYESLKDWYFVEENKWEWPVGTFLTGREILETNHECVEGMTPIDGWFICKTCGTNLKEIK